jgi:hypothetical protein
MRGRRRSPECDAGSHWSGSEEPASLRSLAPRPSWRHLVNAPRPCRELFRTDARIGHRRAASAMHRRCHGVVPGNGNDLGADLPKDRARQLRGFMESAHCPGSPMARQLRCAPVRVRRQSRWSRRGSPRPRGGSSLKCFFGRRGRGPGRQHPAPFSLGRRLAPRDRCAARRCPRVERSLDRARVNPDASAGGPAAGSGSSAGRCPWGSP